MLLHKNANVILTNKFKTIYSADLKKEIQGLRLLIM